MERFFTVRVSVFGISVFAKTFFKIRIAPVGRPSLFDQTAKNKVVFKSNPIELKRWSELEKPAMVVYNIDTGLFGDLWNLTSSQQTLKNKTSLMRSIIKYFRELQDRRLRIMCAQLASKNSTDAMGSCASIVAKELYSFIKGVDPQKSSS